MLLPWPCHPEAGHSRTCRAGRTLIALDTERKACPCILLGETHEGDLAAVWKSMSSWRDLTALLSGECVACPSRNDCGGGCKAEALHERGSYAAIDAYAVPERAAVSPKVLPQPRGGRPLSPGTACWSHPGMTSRLEAFGGILLLDPQHLVSVRSGLHAWFLEHRKGIFTPAELAEYLGAPVDEAIATLTHLAIRRIVKAAS